MHWILYIFKKDCSIINHYLSVESGKKFREEGNGKHGNILLEKQKIIKEGYKESPSFL